MSKSAWRKNDNLFIIPDAMYESVFATQGRFFGRIANVDPVKITNDLLDPEKAVPQAEELGKFVALNKGTRVLEIGSGLGVNLGIWIRKYGIDGFGVEPSGTGFGGALAVARRLFVENALNPARLLNSCGELLPFKSNTFDVVYSTNVLEHTQQPEKVITEGFRVVKPGGFLQVVYPNYHSFFDGHYATFHPPLFAKWLLPLYVRFLLRRDPSYAKTLRTELNVAWTNRLINKMRKHAALTVFSLGEETFKSRMAQANFQEWAGLSRVKTVVKTARKLQLQKLFSFCMIKMNFWTPIILTIKKG